MSVTISAEIDGRHVPLADCDWVLWARCGCVVGLTVAAFPGLSHICATEDQAWPALYDGSAEITQAKERGEHWELITRERTRAEILPSFGNRCPHVKDSSEGERA